MSHPPRPAEVIAALLRGTCQGDVPQMLDLLSEVQRALADDVASEEAMHLLGGAEDLAGRAAQARQARQQWGRA